MVSVYIFFFMVSFKFCKDMLYTAFSPIVGFWLKKKIQICKFQKEMVISL